MQLGSMSSSDFLDAKFEEHQLYGTTQCPGCGYKLQIKPDWVGLPAGVKFDPTDQELIEHLEGKVEDIESKSHPLIDEFIPTIEGDDGICYTHPEKLPGVTRDGLSRHFFHRPSKAYTTGTRKRRKIQTECDIQGGETRWHKTGKTRPVMSNGKQKGCKKILVLYTNFGKNRKPEKTNWVMHQYHLGTNEEEREGELVASKIFYQTQPRQCNLSERANINIQASGSGGGGGGGGGGGDGSGSSSSREMVAPRDELSAAVGAAMSSYGSMDIPNLKADQFSFLRYRKSFDETRITDTSMESTCQEHDIGEQQQMPHHHLTSHDQNPQLHHHHQMATTSFNMSRPTLPISTLISPLHHSSSSSSVIHLDDHSFNVSSLLLHNQNFQHQQQQQQQQQHHKLGGRAASSGLEELIMGCTSTDIKGESTLPNPQDADWLKYSTFWPDSDNPDHHG